MLLASHCLLLIPAVFCFPTPHLFPYILCIYLIFLQQKNSCHTWCFDFTSPRQPYTWLDLIQGTFPLSLTQFFPTVLFSSSASRTTLGVLPSALLFSLQACFIQSLEMMQAGSTQKRSERQQRTLKKSHTNSEVKMKKHSLNCHTFVTFSVTMFKYYFYCQCVQTTASSLLSKSVPDILTLIQCSSGCRLTALLQTKILQVVLIEYIHNFLHCM